MTPEPRAPTSPAGAAPLAGGFAHSDERLALALEAAGAGLWEWNAESQSGFADARICALLGYPAEWFDDTRHFFDAIHPEDAPRVMEAMRAHLAGELPRYDSVHRLRHADGDWRWVHARGAVVERAADGRPRRLVGTYVDVTERREAEATRERALQERDALMRRLVESLPAGAAYCVGDQLYLNPAVEQLTGYAREELPTLDAWFATLYPGNAAAVRAMYEADRARGLGELRIVPVTRKDGRRVLVEFGGHAADGFDVWMLNDVTAREEALASLRRQAVIVDLLHDAVIVTDRESRIVEWNRAAERIFGYAREEVLGRTPEFFHAPSPDADRERMIREGLIADGHWAGELPFRRRDGMTGVLDLMAVALRDETGAITGFIGVNRDVTERRRAERALRESESRFRRLAERAPLGIFQVDADGHTIYVNPRMPAVFGIPAEELLGHGWARQIHPDDLGAMLAEHEAFFAGEGSAHRRLEHRLVLPDGALRWVVVEMTRVTAPDGTLEGAIGTAADVTEQRTLELQGQQARKMEAIGRLAGGVAHDFNNLLTIIRSSTELLAAQLPAGDPRRDDAREVLDAAERAAALTRQLLAFSRRQPATPRCVDVNDAVHEVERMLARLVAPHVQLAVTPSPETLVVRIDPGQLAQVLMNLALNARDAMPEGGMLAIETAAVTLGAADIARWAVQSDVPVQAERPGEYVLVRVTDHGIGMDTPTQRHLFEPFFTTKPLGQGTGLGLSTVYGIVAAAGGHVRVRSAPGRGTAMEVFLPRTVQRHETPAHGFIAFAPHTERATREGETVLLVEDEAAVRLSVSRILQRAGYTVLEARHGGDALRLWRERRAEVGVVLTDVVMPEMGGVELAAALRREDRAVQLLFMSGYTGDTGPGALLRPGDVLLEKPFEAATLLRVVREALDRAPARG